MHTRDMAAQRVPAVFAGETVVSRPRGCQPHARTMRVAGSLQRQFGIAAHGSMIGKCGPWRHTSVPLSSDEGSRHILYPR